MCKDIDYDHSKTLYQNLANIIQEGGSMFDPKKRYCFEVDFIFTKYSIGFHDLKIYSVGLSNLDEAEK